MPTVLLVALITGPAAALVAGLLTLAGIRWTNRQAARAASTQEQLSWIQTQLDARDHLVDHYRTEADWQRARADRLEAELAEKNKEP